MRSFLGALSLLVVLAAAAPFLSEIGPAQARVALAAVVVAAVYFAAKVAAPRIAGLRHLVGLALAVLAIWIGWVAHEAALSTNPIGRGLDMVALDPLGWLAAIETAAETRRFAVGGREVGGGMLLWLWAVLAAVTGLAGLIGGHHAGSRARR